MAESWQYNDLTDVGREERSWHTSFKRLRIEAKSESKNGISCKERSNPLWKFPLESVIVSKNMDFSTCTDSFSLSMSF